MTVPCPEYLTLLVKIALTEEGKKAIGNAQMIFSQSLEMLSHHRSLENMDYHGAWSLGLLLA